jgi:hypothetical protein
VAAVVSFRERCAYHEVGHVAAALVFGVPILAVTVEDRPHLHRGPYLAPTPDLGLEAIWVLCLSGPAAEEMFCGRIEDDGDQGDYAMAREYLARHFDPLHAAVELARCRISAERLVRGARQRIDRLASALLARGTLTGEEVAAFC